MKPVQVKIKNYIYTIMEVNPEHPELVSNDPNIINMGKTLPVNQTILLRDDLKYDRLVAVLVHELNHAYADAYGHSDRTYNEEELCLFNEAYLLDIANIANSYLSARQG